MALHVEACGTQYLWGLRRKRRFEQKTPCQVIKFTTEDYRSGESIHHIGDERINLSYCELRALAVDDFSFVRTHERIQEGHLYLRSCRFIADNKHTGPQARHHFLPIFTKLFLYKRDSVSSCGWPDPGLSINPDISLP